eukprot:3868792-Alexandrium_andersonii.AAC.1
MDCAMQGSDNSNCKHVNTFISTSRSECSCIYNAAARAVTGAWATQQEWAEQNSAHKHHRSCASSASFQRSTVCHPPLRRSSPGRRDAETHTATATARARARAREGATRARAGAGLAARAR